MDQKSSGSQMILCLILLAKLLWEPSIQITKRSSVNIGKSLDLANMALAAHSFMETAKKEN